MAVAYSSAIQDQIAYALANLPYSSLRSEEKDAIDNTWSSGTPGGYAGNAFDKLQQYANFLSDSGTTEVPDAWKAWLVWEVVCDASMHIRREMHGPARERREEAMRAAFSTYTRQDWASPTGTEQWAVTVSGVRLYIVSLMVRMSPSVLPEPAVVDACIRRALNMVWNAKDWPWKRYEDTCTIPLSAGDTTPTVTYASGSTPGRLLSRRPRYSGSSATTGVQSLEPVDTERLTYEQSRGLSDGKPEYFRLTRDNGNELVWEFERGTDQAYTFRAEFTLQTPAISSSSSFASFLNQIPGPEQDLVREVAFALALRAHGRNTGESPEAMIDRAVAENATITDTGDHDQASVETGVRSAFNEMRAARWGGGLGGFV